jgi:protein SCO1
MRGSRWLLSLALATVSVPAHAQEIPWNDIGVTEKLGEQIPQDLSLIDGDAKAHSLNTYLDGKPAVLTLVYYNCTTLCPEVLAGVARSLKGMSLELGKDFRILTVSFDSQEGMEMASAKRREYASDRSGWSFLTGSKPDVGRLTQAVGFRYVRNSSNTQFAHPAVVVVLTGEGIISRYFYSLDVAPRDLELALVEASKGTIGTTVDHVLLYCCQYDPTTGKYGLVISRVISLAGVVTILAIVGLIGKLSLSRGR